MEGYRRAGHRLAKRLLRSVGIDHEVPLTPAEERASRLLSVGRRTYGVRDVEWFEGDETTRVDVGSYCSVATGVRFLAGGNHPLHWISTFPMRQVYGLEGAFRDGHPSSKGNIKVGNDVWIGRDALILSGVSVGDGAVVGAGSVVVEEVRPYAIVVGNPAREVRRRFTDDEVDLLLRLKWWDWDESDVRDAVSLINGPSVSALVEFARSRGLFNSPSGE